MCSFYNVHRRLQVFSRVQFFGDSALVSFLQSSQSDHGGALSSFTKLGGDKLNWGG